jgi:hypothetical protein
MLSAPAHIPAITVSSFGAGFAAPDLIRVPRAASEGVADRRRNPTPFQTACAGFA